MLVVGIVVILVMLLANGVLALSETALVSARKARLQQRAENGDPGAQAALELARAPSHFLSTVQIGITLVGILAGAFGEATLADTLAAGFAQLAWLEPYSKALATGTVVVGLTYLSLIIGELVPKRLALDFPEAIAAAVARPMRALSRLAAPAVHLLSRSTDLVLRLAGVRPSAEPPVTEEEINILIAQGARAGVFEATEQAIVERVFRTADRQVGELMTPRPRIVWVDADDPPEVSWRKMAASGHSYFPVYQDNRDNVLGLASVKLLWGRLVTGQTADLKTCLLKPLVVPETTPAFKVLEQFKQTGKHVALVVNEYGGTEGLLTLIDVVEALVGDLPSIEQPAEAQIVQREDGSWLADGMLTIDELLELLHRELPAEDQGDYQTLGGFVMAELGRLPDAGDRFDWEGFRFEVVDMDGHRVDKVLIAPLHPSPPTDPGIE
jgi:putative hemolysin